MTVDRAAEAVKGLSPEALEVAEEAGIDHFDRHYDGDFHSDCLRRAIRAAVERYVSDALLATIDIAEARGREAGKAEGVEKAAKWHDAQKEQAVNGHATGFMSAIHVECAKAIRNLLPTTSDAKEVPASSTPTACQRLPSGSCYYDQCPADHNHQLRPVKKCVLGLTEPAKEAGRNEDFYGYNDTATHPASEGPPLHPDVTHIASVETPGRAEDGLEARCVRAGVGMFNENNGATVRTACERAIRIALATYRAGLTAPTPPVDQPPGLDAIAELTEAAAKDLEQGWPSKAATKMRSVVAALRSRSNPELPEGWQAFVLNFAESILHGDDQHQAWVRAAAKAYVSGLPIAAAPHPGTLMGEKKL